MFCQFMNKVFHLLYHNYRNRNSDHWVFMFSLSSSLFSHLVRLTLHRFYESSPFTKLQSLLNWIWNSFFVYYRFFLSPLSHFFIEFLIDCSGSHWKFSLCFRLASSVWFQWRFWSDSNDDRLHWCQILSWSSSSKSHFGFIHLNLDTFISTIYLSFDSFFPGFMCSCGIFNSNGEKTFARKLTF